MKRHVILLIGESWRVSLTHEGTRESRTFTFSPEASPADRAAQVNREMPQAAGSPVVLALPSEWCLSAQIAAGNTSRSERRKALAFRLEELLPLSAEDFVAYYHDLPDGSALGVCTDTARLQAHLDALEAADFQVKHVCPNALLAAAHVSRGHSDGAVILSETVGGCDFVEFEQGRLKAWQWFATADAELESALDAWRAAAGGGAELCKLPALPTPQQNLATTDPAPKEAPLLTTELAAVLEGSRLLEGNAVPWIDLGRAVPSIGDSLSRHRSPLTALVLAGVVLLASVAVAAFWRGQRYAAHAQESQRQQVAAFKQVFPDQHAPATIKKTLQAEQLRLASLHGQMSDGSTPIASARTSALVKLRDLLQSLPAASHCQLLDLDIQPDFIRLEGQARSLDDAVNLTAQIRQAGTFDLDPLSTQKLRDGVISFTLVARSPTAKTPGGGS